jgi:predicted nucleic acid-binding protein
VSVELVRLVHHPRYEPGLAGVDLVVAETYILLILLRRAAGYRTAISFLELVGGKPRIKKLYSDPRLEGEAERILRYYTGQGFSFIDAVSFAATKRERIEEAFAFDRHFLIMGFRTVPPAP